MYKRQELKCQGLIDNTVNVENMMNIDMKSSEVVGLIGCPVDISVGVDFDNAILKFYYDDTKLGNVNENDLRIMWYDEENDKYVLLDEETEVDTVNNIVQYETNHFSTYLIVDRTIWLDAVSYTHLDVYKRQAMHNWRRFPADNWLSSMQITIKRRYPCISVIRTGNGRIPD